MRERHFPRLCRFCDAPMAQEDICWSCGSRWDVDRRTEPEPDTDRWSNEGGAIEYGTSGAVPDVATVVPRAS
jgi:hypothetical protein